MEILNDWLSDFSVPVGLVAVLLGLANCFFGYRIFKFLLGVVGFILGAAAGAVLGASIGDGGQLAILLGGLIGGIVGAGLLVALYILGVFLFGASAGAMLLGVIGTALNLELPPVVIIVGAVIVGIIAVVLQKVVIILATAISGAWTAVVGGSALLAGRVLELDQFWSSLPWGESWVPLIVWFILAIAGAIVQFRSRK
jgi:hypothetical protein